MKNVHHFMVWLVLFVFSLPTFAGQSTCIPDTDIPPSTELTYIVKAEYNGLNLNGDSFIRWETDKRTYSLQNEARISLFGKILDADSNGKITERGLVPEKYTEKRLRKAPATTLFNNTDHTVTFRENKTVPLQEMTQDRASIVWQLASVAKAHSGQLVPGFTLTFPVAGRSKIDSWTFHVVDTGDISTPMGKTETVRLSRNGKKGQKMDVWLSPDHNWYPVQILFDEQGGLKLLQTIKKITPQ